MSLVGCEVMMQDKPNKKIGFHLIEDTWDRLRRELSRIIGEEEAVLVAVFRFSSTSIKGDEETGEREEEREVYLETPFVKNVKMIVKKIKEKFKAEPHIHLHPDHGSVTFLMTSLGELLVDSLRGMIVEASTCEECVLSYLEGEVRLGEEVAALFYGSSANVTFILPAADGRRLQIIEAVISI
ncbi:MAG: hypothetical protein LZ172_00785 [Thaumarchaeota archaeon]|nr:hypothetical protein [Candidatus Geocrenenecus arthurdayi]MCL7391586.1 hypothetical protein [Candidatus Geocrenenecus arthurdayi]MCL7402874.1 hypothetical protein [Candidatus Geocrenenecus arthurdayi]